MSFKVDIRRTRSKEGSFRKGPVLYWMSRDQRLHDNWALLYAQELALQTQSPLAIVFCLVPSFLGATIRHFDFMMRGLEELAAKSPKLNIPFILLLGDPPEQIMRFSEKSNASALVSDFSPLRINREWKERVKKKTKIPFFEVDAHNIVPCWIASPKQEFGAYTIRPKINRLLPEYLTDFPDLKKHPVLWPDVIKAPDWIRARQTLQVDREVKEVDWLVPGEEAAQKALAHFISGSLAQYDEARNHPAVTGTTAPSGQPLLSKKILKTGTVPSGQPQLSKTTSRIGTVPSGQSNLSPYFHFGQLAPQRAAWNASQQGKGLGRDAFLEELIIRRELSDNFCYYQPRYDTFEAFPSWAKETLNAHRNDKRPYLYSLKAFEEGQTHDPYWNAAQIQMTATGKMHGYMRMYWAKKILEWTESPEQALQFAIALNDKYELDGRDPNGYAGIAWSLGGVHDRPWNERPIFGKIRYMNAAGLDRKFEMQAYTETYTGLSAGEKKGLCPKQLSMDFKD